MWRGMMKYTILLVLLLIAACTKEEIVPHVTSDAISFGVQEEVKSKAQTNSFFKEGDKFGVYGVRYIDATTTTENIFRNEPVTLLGGAWGYINQKYWSEGDIYQFRAIYPYTNQTEPMVKYIVPQAFGNRTVDTCKIRNFWVNSDITKQVDLMMSDLIDRPVRSKADMIPVSFNFRHLLTKINIKIKKEPRLSNDTIITRVRVQLYGMKSKGNYTSIKGVGKWDVENELVDNVGYSALHGNSKTEVFPKEGGVIMAWPDDKSMGSDGLYLIPQDLTNLRLKVDFIEKVGDVANVMDAYFILPPNPWEAGKQITYVVTIDRESNIKLLAPHVDAWAVSHNSNSIIIR